MRFPFATLIACLAIAFTGACTEGDRGLVGARIAGDPLLVRERFRNTGKGDFLFDRWDGPTLKVWYYLPETFNADSPIVIVMHGNSRDGDRYRDQWADLAAAGNFVVVAPEFPRPEFPTANEYNLGNVFTVEGTKRPASSWSFTAIEKLFDVVTSDLASNATEYTLYGHSAGSQFVHRFLYYVPDARISLAIAANAGWYTLPEYDVLYPYGLLGAGVSENALRIALARHVTVLLGDQDIDTDGDSLRRTPEAMEQGPNRFSRGQYFFEQAAGSAQDLGMDFNWELVVVPGADHDNGKMAIGAAPLIP
jgi:poly(3-hydroxybutyrate) depolymerase